MSARTSELLVHSWAPLLS